MTRHKGKFITFEGSEGSGKSTQAKLVYRYLKSRYPSVLLIREPGGVKISEAIRRILLDVRHKEMNAVCETLLYMAARAQLVEEVIAPVLRKGAIVLCDRFLDSTLVYQGYGHGLPLEFIRSLGKRATQGIVPHLTFIFDIDTRRGLARKTSRKDRIELRSLDYHNRVRWGYCEIASKEPHRVKLIKVDGNKHEVQKVVRGFVDDLLRRNN